MAQTNSVLNRLQGKTVCLHGKFSYGVKEQLGAKAQAHGGKVVEEVDATVDFLVLQDTTAGVGIQKKALAFNSKGAAIQVQSAEDFAKTVVLTEADILALIKGGAKNAKLLVEAIGPAIYGRRGNAPAYTFTGEKFDDLDLSGMYLADMAFDQCSFVGVILTKTKLGLVLGTTHFGVVRDCDFSKCQGAKATFDKVDDCRFRAASLAEARFDWVANTDFSDAKMDGACFNTSGFNRNQTKKQAAGGLIFHRASLRGARFPNVSFAAPDFQQADLTDALLPECSMENANFKEANLQGATLLRAKLNGSDFTKANLLNTNFADADLKQATVEGADFTGANLRGATLSGADMSKAKGISNIAVGTIGPALTELDSLAQSARRINATFIVSAGPGDDGDQVGIDSASFKWGWGVKLPYHMMQNPKQNQSFSAAMLQLANAMGHKRVRYETLEVESTKSAKGGKELRELVLKGIEEAFAQPMPSEADLAAATKLYREADREKNAAAREEREKAKAAAEKAKAAEVKKVEKKIEKAVGKVTDTATFLKALELRIEEAKISKATSMLKKSGFQLYNDVTDEFMSGVVKSQTDPDLVYACRIKSDGSYSCCTQNLNVCGGLRGSICKHLLVLIIGLVQADKLDPNTIDGWVAKSNTTKPVLDKEIMGEIFIRYKGAEAGEVDWRPTETMPEDYYAL